MERDEIVWVRGGVAGSVHDITIARQCFTQHLLPGEAALGDKGYQDSNGHFITPVKGSALSEEDEHWNNAVEKKRKRIERVNKRVKEFRIVKEPFRNDTAKHAKVFRVVCKITNVKLLFWPLNKIQN